MLDIDISRPLKRMAQLQSLIEAVLRANTTDESDWVEWKSDLDVATLHDHRGQIARHMLGMANRMPETATRTAGGYGYILVGVEPGAVPVTAVPDPADLEPWIQQFLDEEAGPVWDWHNVPIGDMSVLVIVVDPPVQGDPVHTLAKEFGKYEAGDIFVRRKGATHKANPTEIRALVARVANAEEEALAVQVCGTPSVRALDWTTEGLADWIHDEEAALLSPLQEEQQEAAMRRWARHDTLRHLQLGGAFANITQAANPGRSPAGPYGREEDRTPEEFREQVRTYVQEAASAGATKAVSEHVRSGQCDVSLRLENPGVVPFRSVSVRLFIPDEGVAAYDGTSASQSLPSRPRKWGPYIDSPLGAHAVLSAQMPDIDPSSFGQAIDIDNGGPVTISFPPRDLGPEDHTDLPAFSLLVPAGLAGASIDVNWEARSAYTRGVPRGTLTINVEDETVIGGTLLQN